MKDVAWLLLCMLEASLFKDYVSQQLDTRQVLTRQVRMDLGAALFTIPKAHNFPVGHRLQFDIVPNLIKARKLVKWCLLRSHSVNNAAHVAEVAPCFPNWHFALLFVHLYFLDVVLYTFFKATKSVLCMIYIKKEFVVSVVLTDFFHLHKSQSQGQGYPGGHSKK